VTLTRMRLFCYIMIVRLLFNGMSALFMLLVPRTVKIQLIRHDKNDFRLTSSTYPNNIDVDTIGIDRHKYHRNGKNLSETFFFELQPVRASAVETSARDFKVMLFDGESSIFE